MAVNVKFTGDTSDYVNALEKSESATEDNQDALEALMKQAIELGVQTGHTADEIADDFSKAFGVPLDRAKRAVQEVVDGTGDLSDAARSAGDDVATGISDGAQTAGDSMTELGSIAHDVLEGDFSSAAESAVSMLGLLGPAGVAAGALVGTAIAGITAAFEANKQKQEDLNKEAAKWAEAYEDAAGRVVSAAFTVGEISAIATDPDRFKDAEKAAKEWGVNTQTAIRALAGDATALAVAQDSLAGRTEAANSQLSEAERNVGALGDQYSSLPEDIRDGQARIDALNDSMAEGARRATIEASALYDYATSVGVATGETDELGNAIIELPDGKQIVVDAETKTAYQELDAFNRKKLNDKSASVKVKFDSSAWDFWQPTNKTAFINTVTNPSGKRQDN